MEFLKGRRKCRATLTSITKRNGEPYPKDDRRSEYIGREGWFEFLNHAWARDANHTASFSSCEKQEDREWSLQTSEIIDIEEDETGVTLITGNSIYRFDLHAPAGDLSYKVRNRKLEEIIEEHRRG